jgi:glycosyltransferase involved in cell wall biosynthesis
MSIALESIIRAATRDSSEPLNIILLNSNERYQSLLAKTGHNFYLMGKWNHTGSLIPENFRQVMALEYGIGYDLVICLGRNRHLQDAKKISKSYHLPLLLLELDYPNVNKEIKKEEGDINVFINERQANAWGFNNNFELVGNGVDNVLFHNMNLDREDSIMTAIPMWKERDWSHGFRVYHKNIDKKLPLKIFGQDNFLHWQELIRQYNTNLIYFNPTIFVPQPMQILEAMACGCIVVALENHFSHELIDNNYNGFLTKAEDINDTLKYVLNCSKNELDLIRKNAYETVVKHSTHHFTHDINKLIINTSNTTFNGKI